MRNGAMTALTMRDGGKIGVYHAHPRGARRGGLVLVQEIFGVTDHIRAMCDGYADDGYEVLAPALFDREAPGFAVGHDRLAEAAKLANETHDFALSIADVQSCIDVLAPAGPVFIVGYCYGGSVAYRAAAACTGLAAASGYYGRLIPLRFMDDAPRCPTILHFGRADAGIPMAGVEALIARDHPGLEVFLYDAGHGFQSDRQDAYDPASAALARARTLALFRAHGG